MGKRKKKRLAKKRRAIERSKKAIHVGGHTHAVTVGTRFLPSLESYFYGRIKDSKIKWEWVGIAAAGTILASSIAAGYFKSTPLFGQEKELMEWAATKGDYQLADSLYQKSLAENDPDVLGAQTQIEEQVYPEKRVQNEIEKQVLLLAKYPGSRDIYLVISKLYQQIGQTEKAAEYRELARILDPNNEIFK